MATSAPRVGNGQRRENAMSMPRRMSASVLTVAAMSCLRSCSVASSG